ncbi:MAG: hypothetical protein Aureis2KO_21030 [Aureisphaera sp.]
MALLVLLPTIANTIHHHSEDEEHLSCKETTTHIHEGHFECSLCFVLITPTLYAPEQEITVITDITISERPEKQFEFNYTSYDLGFKFLRGPPVIS